MSPFFSDHVSHLFCEALTGTIVRESVISKQSVLRTMRFMIE